MNDAPHHDEHFPVAHSKRRHFTAVWLIPIIAALIAAWLGWHNYAQHGPLVTVTFKTAQGLVAGQTQVKYKSVALGTLEDVRLADDAENVEARFRMTASAEPFLTEGAEFWVVKPALNSFNASDIETLVSGSYVQLDPGDEDGKSERSFTGLENPPLDRADQPGRVFILKADKLGAVSVNAPVYFRDVVVGEVAAYDIGDGFGPVTVTIVVHAPYDKLVRKKTRFWNASGLSIALGPEGVHLETHALRSIFAGGIAFITPVEAEKDAPADANSAYTLYDDEKTAAASQYRQSVPYVAYFSSSVKDLAKGAPVVLYGIQVGTVTGVKLQLDARQSTPQVRVDFEIQPEMAFGAQNDADAASTIMSDLVAKGMRVRLQSANLILGGEQVSLEFSPNAAPAQLVAENGVTVLPSANSSDNMMDAITDIANKLNQIPFDDIGAHIDHLAQTLDGKETRQTLHALSVAMTNAAQLSRTANENMTPALQRLPDISAQLQGAVTHANDMMTALDSGNAGHVLDEVNDAARSIRLLADFLERHPEALLNGKSFDAPTPDKPAEKK